jgi:hypothetical protein
MGETVTDQLRVSVDGWTAVANNEPESDVNGCTWAIGDIDGWFGGLSVRSMAAERTIGDGAFDGPIYMGSRRVTVSGMLAAPTPEALQVGMDRIAAVLTSGARGGTLIVDEPTRGLVRSTFCRLDSQGRAKRTSALSADWQITLFCPDPLRYGSARTVSTGLPTSGGGLAYPLTYPLDYGSLGNTGQLVLSNAGTADAPILFSVRGSLPQGFELSAAGGRLTYPVEVPAGQVIDIDTAAGTVLVESTASRRANLTSADWLTVPAGGSLTVQFGSLDGAYDAAAQVTATVQDTYW